MADGGIKSEHRSQKTDVREGCCITFSDLLVAFLTALLSKVKSPSTQRLEAHWSSRVLDWTGSAKPGASSATVTLVGPRPAGRPCRLELRPGLPLPFSALGPIFPDPHDWPRVSDHLLCPRTHMTGPVCLTTFSAPHGTASLLFLKSHRGTDGWGLPRGQGQLSQLPSPECVPPSDTRFVSFNGGWGWREDPTAAVTRLNVVPAGSLPFSCRRTSLSAEPGNGRARPREEAGDKGQSHTNRKSAGPTLPWLGLLFFSPQSYQECPSYLNVWKLPRSLQAPRVQEHQLYGRCRHVGVRVLPSPLP